MQTQIKCVNIVMTNQKRLLHAILRQDFTSFIAKVFHTINPGTEYIHNWHIELIAEYLEYIRVGKIKRLIINIPPRALKSICTSVAFPAWLLGHDPTYRIMSASYSSILSIKHSLDCRFILSSKWYQELFCDTKLSTKQNQKSKFLTTENGFRFATSVGGSATGEGGDILIIDDPHNPTHINSRALRNKAIDWFEQTFVSRLNNKNTGAIIVVMQRLHEHDLAGHLIANSGWEVLKIPAIAAQDMYYKLDKEKYVFKEGELLNAHRDKIEFLQNLEKEIGVRAYAAQYLQDPLPQNFNLVNFDDLHFFTEYPSQFEYYIQSWDTAIKTSEKADYSVCTTWGVINKQYYLLSMIRQKFTYPNLKNIIEKENIKYKPKYLLIEDKASGQSIIQDLKLNGYHNIYPIKPKFDKITRFAATVPLIQSGKILFPKHAHFMSVILKEITNFPGTMHDDIVDSISQCLQFIKIHQSVTQPKIRVL